MKKFKQEKHWLKRINSKEYFISSKTRERLIEAGLLKEIPVDVKIVESDQSKLLVNNQLTHIILKVAKVGLIPTQKRNCFEKR
ncbi:MAG: hypothetical protein PV340_05150 [Wolbachia sp.]|nr:hypothetical protein [Wolbachia sp.]MDD9336212.1 hypothetical protein [Wolbachia sp.]